MSDDQEQRNLEVVKLRITFLQHMTTLSGAATLIILALMQRTKDPQREEVLTFALSIFALAAVVSVTGLMVLMSNTDRPLRDSDGLLITMIVGSMFTAGVLTVMIFSFRNPVVDPGIIVFYVAGVSAVIMLPLTIYIRRDRKKSRGNESGENGEDQDATPRP